MTQQATAEFYYFHCYSCKHNGRLRLTEKAAASDASYHTSQEGNKEHIATLQIAKVGHEMLGRRIQ